MNVDQSLFSLARPWIEETLGFPLPEDLGTPGLLIAPGPGLPESRPLYGVRIDGTVAITCQPRFLDSVRPVVESLHPDQLFSVLGTYELSRSTLAEGVAVWGPVPNYLASPETWRPVADARPVRLSEAQLAGVDWKVFWHCERSNPIAAFGIYESKRIVALATVGDRGHRIWEIGVDVAPERKGQGLGRAVISAAGNWILANGGNIHATVAFWNVPSSRTMRSLGLKYSFSVLNGYAGPFRVPPQPLGKPRPGVEIFDNYPRWAMNQEIRSRPDVAS
ncbi:MAG: GNAT family N-acetyltransferase [Chloroflexi bacterium]|nr:GNAT family N-acetyltransferase [Chloroflexota bacterium]